MEKSLVRLVVRTVCLQAIALCVLAAARVLPDAQLADFFQAGAVIATAVFCLLAVLLPSPDAGSLKRNLVEGMKDVGKLVITPAKGWIQSARGIWPAERQPVKR